MPDPTATTAPASHVVPSRRSLLAAAGYALAIWAVATIVLVAVGGRLLPGADDPAAAVVYLVAAAGSGAVGVLAGHSYLRRFAGGMPPLLGGLVLGAAIATVGLTLDTVLMGALGHGYPGVSGEQADTVAVGLLVGHAAALLGAAGAGWRLQSRQWDRDHGSG